MNRPDEIVVLQDLPSQLDILLEARTASLRSRSWRFWRYVINVLLAISAIVFVVLRIEVGVAFATTSLIWLVLREVLFQSKEIEWRRGSAALTDQFERVVLGLHEDSIIEVARPNQLVRYHLLASADRKGVTRHALRGWFRVKGHRPDQAVAECVLYSARFGWNLAREWWIVNTALWVSVICSILAFGVWWGFSIADFIGLVALPIAPLILDLVHSANLQRMSMRGREGVVAVIDASLKVGSVDVKTLRDSLRAAFEWRTQTVNVPDLYYRFRRQALEKSLA